METLETSRICRLCGKHSGISIDIFDKNESHVKKINAILPILVHEMDLLPKHMCHRCSYKLEEFHKFYIECLKTDATLKNQLSWMRKDETKEKIGVPMVHIENVKIKSEPQEMDPSLLERGLVEFPVPGVQTGLPDCIMYTSFANTSRCQCYCDKANPTRQTISKDCTHAQLELRETTDLAFHLNGVTESQQPEILWKKRRNLFGSAKDPQNPQILNEQNSSAVPAFPESTLPNTGTLARTLRPRKRSVDYVGTKRKTPASDPENGSKNTETKTALGDDLVIVKNKPLEVKQIRTLRPRKHLETEVKIKETRSKSAERSRKRVKTNSRNSRRSRSVAQEVLGLEIKKELVNSIEENEALKLRLKTEPLDHDSPWVSNPSSKKRNEGSKVAKVGLKIRKNELLDKNLKIRKTELNGKEELKTAQVFSKRRSKVQFSPKNLRSQDLHLRSGKVKAMDALRSKSLRKDVRKSLLDRMTDHTKTRVVKSANVDIKHLCEKCNFIFVNKELFRLHACYSN